MLSRSRSTPWRRRLKKSFDDLVGEVETRKSRERELKESEARLRMSEERLQLAIDAAGLGIWDWNVEQDRLVWDDSMYRLYGVRKDEFSGAFDAWSRCLVPEDMARAKADVEAALRGEREFVSDFRVRRADGAIRIIRGVGQIVQRTDGRPVRMVGINRDVTDLINAEREREQLVHDLRRSASYLAEAEKLSHTGCWARNTRTGEVFWSPGQWRIFGLDPATTQLSHQLFVELIHPEDRAFVEESNAQAIRARKSFDISFRAMLRDGTVKNLHSVGKPFDESGEEYIGVTTDETERVRANAAVHEAQAELARVARLTTMGELAASIAHEINQPLTAVVAYGNGALRWLAHTPPNVEEVTESLKGIVEEGTRAGEVIARVRELLKHRKPDYVALDTNDAIREVLALTGSALRSRSVAVQTTLPADLPLALGDRVQLQQVIMNLVMNGADAMSTVTERPRVLRIESKVDGESSIQVTIRDSGIGIEEAIRHRIFDPLFTTKPTGMGMGLSICRSIIEAHGGRLWASPGTTHGTDFQFTIPDRRSTDRRQTRATDGSGRCQRIRSNRREQESVVFVIDDDPGVRASLQSLLRSIGLKVETFNSAADFVVSKIPSVPSCLVLDVRLPDVGGLDFQAELAKRNIQIPIIFITGHGDIPMTVRAMKAGAVEFLPKPFREQDMLDAVRAGLARDRARLENDKATSRACSQLPIPDRP